MNLLKRRVVAFNRKEVGMVMKEEELEAGGRGILFFLLCNFFFLIAMLIPKESDFLSSFSVNHHLCSNMTNIYSPSWKVRSSFYFFLIFKIKN